MTGSADEALPPFDVRPVTLEGQAARLEPLTPGHAGRLAAAGADPRIWEFTTGGPLATDEAASRYIAAALDGAVPFAIVDRASGQVVGSTRYFDIRPRDRGLEIGYTWLNLPFQRTAINTECKCLLLHHAFETLGAERVQLKTDRRNLRSQAAIERIGGVREGVLRRHMVLPDGSWRDTVMYSIVRPEWPAVKRRLEALRRR